jgi:hypothetical protein
MKKKILLSIIFVTYLQADNTLLKKQLEKKTIENPEKKHFVEKKAQFEKIKQQEITALKKKEKPLEKKLQEKKIALQTEKKDQFLNQVSVAAKEDAKEFNAAQRSFIIKNNITEATITYDKHWAKPFPTTFSAKVNDQEYLTLQKGKLQLHNTKISGMHNKIKVSYEWAIKYLGKVRHHEHKLLEFEVPEKQEELTISFCWDDENRIIIPNAKLINSSTITPSNI